MKRFAPLLLIIFVAFTFYQCDTFKKIQPTNTETSTENVEPENEKPGVKYKPVIGFTGTKHYPPSESVASKQKKDSLLAIAQTKFDENPDSLDYIIWLGRRTAYLWQYDKAIEIYSDGLEKHPNSPELYRHRGHRYISIRDLDKAIADFEKAAELVAGRPIQIEPDGIPNSINQPLSNLQFNIWYHWGLAYYLKGDFAKAAEIYEKCMDFTINADLIVATVDWLYMALRRDGRKDEATRWLRYVDPDMRIIENKSYFYRLLMYKGKYAIEDLYNFEPESLDAQLDLVTQGYGVGNWYFYNDDVEKAKAIYEQLLATDYWSAFGYIAAEADMKNAFKKR